MEPSKNKRYFLLGIILSLFINIFMLILIGLSKPLSKNTPAKNIGRKILAQEFIKQQILEQSTLKKKSLEPEKQLEHDKDPKKSESLKKEIKKAKPKKLVEIELSPTFQPKVMLTSGSPVWFDNNVPAITQKAPDLGVNNIVAPQDGAILKASASDQTKKNKPDAENKQNKVQQTNIDLEKKPISKSLMGPKEAFKSDEKKTEQLPEPKIKEKTEQPKQNPELVALNQQKETEKKVALEHKKSGQIKAFDHENMTQNETKELTLETATEAIKKSPIETKVIDQEFEKESVSAVNFTGKTKAPISPSKETKGNFSLKGLQNGFTQYLRKGNNSSVNRSGALTGDIDTNDLKLISFYKHIGKIVDSSLSFVGFLNVQHLCPDHGPIMYELVIERDGTISSHRLIQKSQHDILNEHTLKIIENLGSLPRVPSYIQAPHIYTAGVMYFNDPILFFR